MPITTNISVSQTIGLPTTLVITDESTGSDGSVTERRVYLQKSDGTYLVPEGTQTPYIVWPIADSTISLEVLDQDYALAIRVVWVDVDGNILYSFSDEYVFTLYSEQFYYNLTQALAANYPIIADNNYYDNKARLRVEIDSANQAISIGGDIAASQACLDRAAYMISNQSLYF